MPHPTKHACHTATFRLSCFAVVALTVALLPGSQLGAAKLTPLQMEEGKYLSSMCTTCHQPGKKAEGIPRITGYSTKEMLEMMMDYRGGKEHHGAMENIAQSLTDAELRILSAYMELTSPPASKDKEAAK